MKKPGVYRVFKRSTQKIHCTSYIWSFSSFLHCKNGPSAQTVPILCHILSFRTTRGWSEHVRWPLTHFLSSAFSPSKNTRQIFGGVNPTEILAQWSTGGYTIGENLKFELLRPQKRYEPLGNDTNWNFCGRSTRRSRLLAELLWKNQEYTEFSSVLHRKFTVLPIYEVFRPFCIAKNGPSAQTVPILCHILSFRTTRGWSEHVRWPLTHFLSSAFSPSKNTRQIFGGVNPTEILAQWSTGGYTIGENLKFELLRPQNRY
jgi:hypothetical protein